MYNYGYLPVGPILLNPLYSLFTEQTIGFDEHYQYYHYEWYYPADALPG
jgi:hypothetical protein